MPKKICALALVVCYICMSAAHAQQDSSPQQPSAATASTPDSPVQRIVQGVTPPVGIYLPEARFTEQARKEKFKGNVEISLIVGSDGLVYSPRVNKDPGMGLAQIALDTVKKYKFKPAMKDGQPVAVRILIQIAINIY